MKKVLDLQKNLSSQDAIGNRGDFGPRLEIAITKKKKNQNEKNFIMVRNHIHGQ